MERNQVIGLILLFGLLYLYMLTTGPSKEELEAQKMAQDSIAQQMQIEPELEETFNPSTETVPSTIEDSVLVAQNAGIYGPFAGVSVGEPKTFILENDLVKVTFSNKGGRVTSVELKEHKKVVNSDEGKDTKVPVILQNDRRNMFEYWIPMANIPSGRVSTDDLYFSAEQSGQKIVFTIPVNGGNFVQSYELLDGYALDYQIDFGGLKNIIKGGSENITLNWEDYLDKIEKNAQFEQSYSAVYYKLNEDDSPEDCGCMSSEKEDESNNQVDWFSHSNQYFNSTLMAQSKPFTGGVFESIKGEEDDDFLEKLITQVDLPLEGGRYDMELYFGPNEYKRLAAYDNSLEYIIPFGTSLFGTINRWVIRPFFNFLSTYIGNKGLVIIALIFIIKMLLYPLMYKILHSQALMGALKPELAHLTEKYKDDAQRKQMETMKIYREYGVSPLGGCLPMIIQIPIWYALFRFFPASITFRQESFWWADDLSSYDDFFHLPFSIPFMGDHLSLFTILWAVSTLVYTYYNTRHMDMSANPAMKYMQYFMPVMFLGFFNTYASGLTCYMFFSNLINIIQTVVTKRFIFKDEKLRAELKKKKSKPKKKSGFQARLEEAYKMQQESQAKKKK